MAISSPRGVFDILPADSWRWRWLEEQCEEVCRRYGYKELRIPYFEHTELFLRGVGEATDIVRKEMYSFQDRGERSLTLRPELTAGVVRSFIEHKMHNEPLPVRLFTIGPSFRYERPQAGRYRQFHQLNVELFGTHSPLADGEMISVGLELFHHIGLTQLTPIQVQLNSIGCSQCRPRHRTAMMEFLEGCLDKVCSDCNSRYRLNPLRVFDCKNSACQVELTGLPVMIDFLCPECDEHFASVQEVLGGYNISYSFNSRLVRGLDYYNRTVFEYFAPQALGIALGGGGRYDPLVELLGGPPVPGVGFAVGIERLLLSLTGKELKEQSLDIYLAPLGEAAELKAIPLAQALRRRGLSCEVDLMQRSLRTQLRQADRLAARYVLILGQDELESKSVLLRNMTTKEQQLLTWTELESFSFSL